MNQRPAGIIVIAALYIILGVLSLLWGFLILGVGGLSSLFGILFGAESISTFGSSNMWTGFFGILSAIVQIVVAFGLLAMKKWAWILAIVGVGLTVIQGVINLFGGRTFAFICGSLWLIIPVIILVYLLSKGIRSAYQIG